MNQCLLLVHSLDPIHQSNGATNLLRNLLAALVALCARCLGSDGLWLQHLYHVKVGSMVFTWYSHMQFEIRAIKHEKIDDFSTNPIVHLKSNGKITVYNQGPMSTLVFRSFKMSVPIADPKVLPLDPPNPWFQIEAIIKWLFLFEPVFATSARPGPHPPI